MDCKLKDKCKRAESCSLPCYPFSVMYGNKGDGGYWNTKNTPKKYAELLLKDLPIEKENPDTYKAICKYVNNVLDYVREESTGLYLFSIPNASNRLGTGTGKTTTACIILNEYLLARVIDMLQKKELLDNVGYFVRLSEFQNKYNEQFRGSVDNQHIASDKFYTMKKRMKDCELLVIDDIAIRDCTEAFKNEIYDIVDYRAVEELATIFTSNIPLEGLSEILGERTASRIEGMTVPIGFRGVDHRKRGLV